MRRNGERRQVYRASTRLNRASQILRRIDLMLPQAQGLLREVAEVFRRDVVAEYFEGEPRQLRRTFLLSSGPDSQPDDVSEEETPMTSSRRIPRTAEVLAYILHRYIMGEEVAINDFPTLEEVKSLDGFFGNWTPRLHQYNFGVVDNLWGQALLPLARLRYSQLSAVEKRHYDQYFDTVVSDHPDLALRIFAGLADLDRLKRIFHFQQSDWVPDLRPVLYWPPTTHPVTMIMPPRN